jgi:hypothetical protein
MTDGAVYEMFWDCGYCGTTKLLGLTHRHCPSCGAPQDPAKRYFPSDADKVLARDHMFVGADRTCPACRAPNSARSQCCGGCGAPLDGAAEVARVVESAVAAAPALKPPRKSRKPWIWGVLAALVLGIWVFTRTKPATLSVAGHRWKRTIEIERLVPATESAWCDQVPAGVQVLDRSREVRSQRKVEDGEDCNTRKVDQGDGTYVEREECRPRYRSEPIYGERCRYTVLRWQTEQTLESDGTSLLDAPRWPLVQSLRAGKGEGSEREGQRSQRYTLTLVDGEGDEHTCEVDEPTWRALRDGAAVEAEVRALTGAPACDRLRVR